MSFTYSPQKRRESKRDGAEPADSSGKEFTLPNSAQLTELGHQVDMPEVMREKMEGAFGMDFSAVKLYENRAVGDAGAEAVARGSRIAFAPGKLDFSSTRGQALLGHEMSHVASQARGEVKGSGLVNDSALEARADQEGLRAARGESISAGYGGAAAPLSNASAASPAGPMQAKSGKKRDVDAENVKRMKKSGLNYNSKYATSDMEGYNDLPANQWEEKTHSPGFFSYLFGNRGIRYKKRRSRLPFRQMPVDTQSEESYNLLNTQQGTADERLDAYRNLADQVEQNTTPDEQAELGRYVDSSEPTNLLLRGQKENLSYPSNQNIKDESLRTSRFVSSAIEKNRIQKRMNVFRGIPDSKLGEILTQKGLTRAIKRNGGLDYQWIRDNMQKVQQALINTTFADNGFTSTTTEKNFARYWAQHKNHTEKLARLYRIQNRTPEEEELDRYELSDPKKNTVPGGHIIHMSLPAGSRSAAIGGAAKVPGKPGTSIKMHEVLVDKGSLFRITGFNVNNDKDAGPDSFNLMMELLSDEEGMEPAGNAVENLIQPNGAGNGFLNYGGNDLLNNGGDDLLIDDDDADNRAVMGDEDAERLKRIMKKGKKKKKKKH